MQKLLYCLAFAAILMFGCGKDSDIFVPNPNEPLPERVVASVFGVVTDQFGEPVSGADVLLESHSGTTNERGLFLFRDVEIYEDTYLKVDKPGYFNGSRRFYPKAGNTAQVKIQLLSSTTVGSFQSAAGGSMDLNGGTRLTFPPDAIVTQGGAPYSGTVNVAAVPLYTSDPELADKMPGDLVGKNADGLTRVLGSYGMVAAELRDASGALLQMASGMKATIEFAIAGHQLSSAPSTIPLWYYDEETGYWKEEGEAQRNGNSYIGEVAHFSFWNCDAPFPLITLTGSVVYTNGEPGSGLSVCITAPGLNVTGYGGTDAEGVFTGKVPKDQELIIRVKDYNGCELLEFEVTVGPFQEDVTIPPITINFSVGELVEVTGTLVDCNSDPVEDGIVEIFFGNTSRYVYVDEGNTFTSTFYNCDEGPVTVKAYDYIHGKESLPVTLNHAPMIDFGAISICEDLTEYLNVFADGQTIALVVPQVYVNTTGSMNTGITGMGIQDSTTYFYVNVPGTTTGTYDIGNPSGAEVFLDLGFGIWGTVPSGTCTFTYFGEPGDFVMGTMEGTYVEYNNMQQQMAYPFTVEFKILRD